MDTRRFELNAPAVLAEAIDGEVMVMNLQHGIYYSVTGTAAHAWPQLVTGVAVAEVGTAVAHATGHDPSLVGRDLAAFVDRLTNEAILRPATGVTTGPATLPAATYAGFGFERFDDMRAMLVIDPVHEVGDFGWPQQGTQKDA